jgi:hypothetical protein
MKKHCLLLLLSCLPLCLAQSGRPAPGDAQGTVAADFPKELLQGSEKFTLAIDVHADIRGNYGPCG